MFSYTRLRAAAQEFSQNKTWSSCKKYFACVGNFRIQTQQTMSSKQNHDEEFLSLLSAQREILKRLKKETSYNSVANEGDPMISIEQTQESTMDHITTSNKQGLFDNGTDPLFLMNEPIIERRLSQEGILNKAESRRISGHGISAFTTPPSTHFFDSTKNNRRNKQSPQKFFQMDSSTYDRRSAERRIRLHGMLANALMLDMNSTSSNDLRNTIQSENGVFLNDPIDRRKRVERLHQNIDLATLRGEFVNFLLAMEKSMKSQQDIHDWDRKMGLKRSHSKTMRLSMRSRNKLRKVINV
jgi:hypothetical protein